MSLKNTFLCLLLVFICVSQVCSQVKEDIQDSSSSSFEPIFLEYIKSAMNKIKNNDFNGAMEDLSSAINIDDRYAPAYYNRGVCQFKLGNFDESLEDFDNAINLKDDYIKAYRYRAMAKKKLGQYNEALEDFQIAQKLYFLQQEEEKNNKLNNSKNEDNIDSR